MDRFGVFVDAGYLYAASGKLLFGTTDRKKFSLNFESIVERLVDLGAVLFSQLAISSRSPRTRPAPGDPA